jgi:hypothetical protein
MASRAGLTLYLVPCAYHELRTLQALEAAALHRISVSIVRNTGGGSLGSSGQLPPRRPVTAPGRQATLTTGHDSQVPGRGMLRRSSGAEQVWAKKNSTGTAPAALCLAAASSPTLTPCNERAGPAAGQPIRHRGGCERLRCEPRHSVRAANLRTWIALSAPVGGGGEMRRGWNAAGRARRGGRCHAIIRLLGALLPRSSVRARAARSGGTR